MSIETPEELEALRAAGRVVAAALQAMRSAVQPGVTTAEVDRIAGRIFANAGARSGPQLDYDFPGVCCISVNDEAVHGIPGPRRLQQRDLVKLDVTAELNGFYADACVTVAVGQPLAEDAELIATAEQALADGLRAARAGAPVNAIGSAVEQRVRSRGHHVCRELMGHGIGRRIHELPHIPNYYVPQFNEPLTSGLVLTIEPIIATGSGSIRMAADGWTMLTRDRSRAAHVEHTVVIQDGDPLILTA